jgi:hypothetical protein
MKGMSETVKRLQAETAHKENVVLAMYSGLLGFSGACLLAVLAGNERSTATIGALCLFVVATFSYATIVLGKVFVLHKGQSLHIGHVIVAEDAAAPALRIGGPSLVSGLGLYSAGLSWWCSAFVIICAVVAFRHHLRFKKSFNLLMDARDIQPARAEQGIDGGRHD